MSHESFRKMIAKQAKRQTPRGLREEELESVITEGDAYHALINSYGWELLCTQFLNVVGDTDRLLSLTTQRLKLQREAIKAALVKEMRMFIESKLQKKEKALKVKEQG